MFANNLNTIITKFIKIINFVFEAIKGFVFRAIISFIFNTITSFIFVAINLLYDDSGEYLPQIKVGLKKTIVYLDKNYLRYVYLYQCFYCKY